MIALQRLQSHRVLDTVRPELADQCLAWYGKPRCAPVGNGVGSSIRRQKYLNNKSYKRHKTAGN